MVNQDVVWEAFVCRTGLLLRNRNGAAKDLVVSGTLLRPSVDVVLLSSSTDDYVVDNVPLAITLREEEVADLRQTTETIAAATAFGPAGQEKASNEDFALASCSKDAAGRDVAIGIVADGVSTKTFWPARSARIATLVAYRTVREAAKSNLLSNPDSLTATRNRLVADLRAALRADQAALLRLGALPPGWDPQLFKAHSNRDSLWYNTTLLVGALTADHGLLMFSGDGALLINRHSLTGPPELLEPLRSDENLAIRTFVSLGVTEADFEMRTVTLPDAAQRLDILIASDGVDRTLSRKFGTENSARSYLSLDLRNSVAASACLDQMAHWPEAVVDNLSVVRLTWPLGLVWPAALQSPGEAVTEQQGAPQTAETSATFAQGPNISTSAQRRSRLAVMKSCSMARAAPSLYSKVTLRIWSLLGVMAASALLGGAITAVLIFSLLQADWLRPVDSRDALGGTTSFEAEPSQVRDRAVVPTRPEPALEHGETNRQDSQRLGVQPPYAGDHLETIQPYSSERRPLSVPEEALVAPLPNGRLNVVPDSTVEPRPQRPPAETDILQFPAERSAVPPASNPF